MQLHVVHKVWIGAIHCPAQILDPSFAQQSSDWLCNVQIVPNEVCKAWINDQSLDCPHVQSLVLTQQVCKVWIKADPPEINQEKVGGVTSTDSVC